MTIWVIIPSQGENDRWYDPFEEGWWGLRWRRGEIESYSSQDAHELSNLTSDDVLVLRRFHCGPPQEAWALMQTANTDGPSVKLWVHFGGGDLERLKGPQADFAKMPNLKPRTDDLLQSIAPYSLESRWADRVSGLPDQLTKLREAVRGASQLYNQADLFQALERKWDDHRDRYQKVEQAGDARHFLEEFLGLYIDCAGLKIQGRTASRDYIKAAMSAHGPKLDEALQNLRRIYSDGLERNLALSAQLKPPLDALLKKNWFKDKNCRNGFMEAYEHLAAAV
jgi:hypothetical protein